LNEPKTALRIGACRDCLVEINLMTGREVVETGDAAQGVRESWNPVASAVFRPL
jgi:hypothetical protein